MELETSSVEKPKIDEDGISTTELKKSVGLMSGTAMIVGTMIGRSGTLVGRDLK